MAVSSSLFYKCTPELIQVDSGNCSKVCIVIGLEVFCDVGLMRSSFRTRRETHISKMCARKQGTYWLMSTAHLVRYQCEKNGYRYMLHADILFIYFIILFIMTRNMIAYSGTREGGD